MCSKIYFFSTSIFQLFFAIFVRFWEILGRQAPPKNHHKSSKMPKKWIFARVLDASFFEGGFGEGLGSILEGFWEDFEWIFHRILEGF